MYLLLGTHDEASPRMKTKLSDFCEVQQKAVLGVDSPKCSQYWKCQLTINTQFTYTIFVKCNQFPLLTAEILCMSIITLPGLSLTSVKWIKLKIISV